MADSDYLLDLKNDKTMRQFAVVTNKPIKRKDHIAWLDENLSTIQIVLLHGKRAGMLRVTKEDEVSINIDPEFRGMGVGTKAMKYCPKNVWAKIVDGNVASMNLFIKSGFKIVDHQNNYYVLQN